MTRHEINTYLAAILTTVAEHEADTGRGVIESIVYLAVGSDIHKWNTLKHIMLESGMVTIKSNVVSLTPKGKELADKCNALLTK